MDQYAVSALVNGLAVAAGLFVLWSFVGRIRHTPVASRALAALIAGAVSAVITLAVTHFIAAST
jgi:hypothetical protein